MRVSIVASSDAFPDLSTLKYVSRWSGMTVMEIFRTLSPSHLLFSDHGLRSSVAKNLWDGTCRTLLCWMWGWEWCRMGFRSLREFLDFFGFGFDLHDSDEMDHSAVVPLFIDRQRRLGPGPVACRPIRRLKATLIPTTSPYCHDLLQSRFYRCWGSEFRNPPCPLESFRQTRRVRPPPLFTPAKF